MNRKKLGTALLVGLLLVSMAGPAMAKGGRGGGGGLVGGSPSISRQAPAPSQSQRQQAAPSQKQSASENGTQKRNIDQGIDPADYGKRNAGSGSTTSSNQAGQAAAQNTRSNFFGGGGGFFSGFSSFWPWLWISSWFGHGNAAASDGQTEAQPEEAQTESWWDAMSQWWTNFVHSVKALFGM